MVLSSLWQDALGTSDIFLAFQEQVARLARCERPLLIVGERGTGKELTAQRLHYLSARWEHPLITVLCPALSPSLLEAELFGHEAGAFTGARGRRPGYFERANGGTLFLDEVGDMPLSLQDKLLRVVEYGQFERVGGIQPVQVDVRILAATNRDLPALAAQGKFREDLLDRLSFEVVHIPPLRIRGEDILLLARHFAARMLVEQQYNKHSSSGEEGTADDWLEAQFEAQALEQLSTYSWPGNVRELKNAVERAVLRHGAVIPHLDLDPFRKPHASFPLHGSGGAQPPSQGTNQEEAFGKAPSSSTERENTSPFPEGFSLPQAVEKVEREALHKALVQSRYRQKEAAALLGLTYHQFRGLFRKYGGQN